MLCPGITGRRAQRNFDADECESSCPMSNSACTSFCTVKVKHPSEFENTLDKLEVSFLHAFSLYAILQASSVFSKKKKKKKRVLERYIDTRKFHLGKLT